jgi:hypothetical protein
MPDWNSILEERDDAVLADLDGRADMRRVNRLRAPSIPVMPPTPFKIAPTAMSSPVGRTTIAPSIRATLWTIAVGSVRTLAPASR